MTEETLADMLKTLSPTQLDFVQVRMFAPSDKAAAKTIGIHEDTVYAWPNIATVRACVNLAKIDGVNIANEKLRRAASEAVDVLVDELHARRGSNKRLDAAIEILNRTIGKPTDRQEISGPGGAPLKTYITVTPDDWPSAV